LGTIASQLMFNSITASINSEALKSHKALVQIYLKMNYSLNIKRKIKVIKLFLTYFESIFSLIFCKFKLDFERIGKSLR
jgi:hypothetical protein